MRDQAIAVQRLFDAKAASWSAKYASGGSLSDRVPRFLASISAHLSAPVQLLDLGCGTGELALALSAEGYRVTATDSSRSMLDVARSAPGSSAVEWVDLDPGWENLPFAHESFDAVTSSSVLEYVARPDAFLSECRRLLRRNGLFVCTVPDPRHFVRRVEGVVRAGLLLAPKWLVKHAPTAVRPYLDYLRLSKNRLSISEWELVAQKAGLSRVAIEGDCSAASTPLALLVFRRSE